MKKLHLLTGALLATGLYSATAQEVTVDALIRPRFEYRHGFQDVAADGAEGSSFVSQRSSLLLKYTDAKITTFLDLQDVSIWGDRAQLSQNDDGDGFRLNQAWASLKLGNGWSTKIGRQTIDYDDQRIFGSVGWTQQQRTHDAAILTYKTAKTTFDAGFAFNQNREGNALGGNTNLTNAGNIFTPSGPGVPLFQYKAMQYLHINSKLSETLSGSFLFVNNTFQDPSPTTPTSDTQGTNSRQTTGIYGKYKEGKFGLDFSGYYQFGEVGSNELSAFQASANASYKVGSTILGLGGEILSGDDNGASDGEVDSFFPLFGTNHKFNGYQDFFFVGRHANNVGLIDLNAKAVFKTSGTSSLTAAAHYFSAAKTPSGADSYIGTAIDLVYKQKINSFSSVLVGYSQSFLDSDFADGRAGGEADDIQNWGWVMLVIKPNLFKWKKDATK